MIKDALGGLAVLFFVCLTASAWAADKPAEAGNGSSEMQRWWADLQEGEPKASRALLNFSSHPDESVAFLKKQLRPLKLSADDLNLALEALGSDKASEWKPAYELLEYLDPRLAMDLNAVMNQVTEYPARSRLVEILSDRPMDSLKGKKVDLRHFGTGANGGDNFSNGQSSWGAEAKIERLGIGGWGTSKPKWQRALRAIMLLKHIGTPDALAIINDLAGGHPDAVVTKVAKEELGGK